MSNNRLLLVLQVSAVLFCSPAGAQTIPELLAKAGESLGRTVEIETGPPPSVEVVVQGADLIVSGVVGRPTVYLSADQKEVYSDYPIIDPRVLFADPAAAIRPGTVPSLMVTHVGGQIEVNGLTFSMEHKLLPPLKPGTTCLFLLERTGDKYTIAGRYYGVFGVEGGRLRRLQHGTTYADEYRGMPLDEAISRIVSVRGR